MGSSDIVSDVKVWIASEDLMKEGKSNKSLLSEPPDFLHCKCTMVFFKFFIGVESCSLKPAEIQDPAKRKKKKAKRRKYRT